MAVSRDDKYVALSVNDQIQIYRLDLSVIRRVILPGQMQSYQLAPHLARNLSVDPNALQSPSKKALTWKEAEQEAQRQSALIERKLWFSEDSQKLVIATHLGDHHVYLDVWDCSTDPFKITSDYSRSFKLPPVSLRTLKMIRRQRASLNSIRSGRRTMETSPAYSSTLSIDPHS